MTKFIQESLLLSVKEAKNLYNRLVLFVGPSGDRKTTILNQVAKELGKNIINVNLEFSKRFLEMTNKKRALKASRMFEDILGTDRQTIILDKIAILFDINLKQDPLTLLQKASRYRTIIASFDGIMEDKKLIYAEPDHPEYRVYNIKDTLIVSMNGNLM